MTKFEQLVTETGEFGVYQARLLLMVTSLVVAAGYNTNLPIFQLSIPDHRCALDNYDNDTYLLQGPRHAALVNASIPLDASGQWSACTIRRHVTNSSRHVTGTSRDKMSVVACDRWVYDHQYFQRSVIEELDVVCDLRQWRAHGHMAMAAGKLVSAVIQGLCSDLFGRRRTLLVFIVVMIGSTFASGFIFNFASLIAFRFLAGIATTSIYLNCFVIGLEFLGLKHRQKFSVAVAQAFVVGGFVVTGAAYCLRDFRDLCLALGAPTVCFIAYFWLLPESPRWLLSNGRSEEARVIVASVAKTNGVAFPDRLFRELVEEAKEDARKEAETQRSSLGSTETLLDLVKHKKLAVRLFIVLFNWFANALTFFGTLLNVQNLSGSLYVNFTYFCLVDLAGNSAFYLLADRVGRRRLYLVFLGMAVVACLAVVLPSLYAPDQSKDTILIVLFLVGRLGISTSFNILYLYSAEMFPTTVRNSAMGVSSMTSRVGFIVAPYIADIGLTVGGQLEDVLPLLVFGGAGFLAFTSTLALPETNDRKLPDKIAEEKK